MAANSIKLSTLATAVALVAVVELSAPALVRITGWPRFTVLGMIRAVEIAAMVAAILYFETGLSKVGWAPQRWIQGLKIGALWSLGFGLLTAVGMAALYVSGRNPLLLIRAPLPEALPALLSFFIVGGLIGPVAEELCFRGLLYTFFRRWGILAAIGASTAVFVLLHGVHAELLVPMVGGLVFALAYEATGNLMVPMVIHVLANCAIFALSLPIWR